MPKYAQTPARGGAETRGPLERGPRGDRPAGRFEFCRRFPAFHPVVVGDAPHLGAAERAGAQGVTWEQWLTAAGAVEVLPDGTGAL